MFRVIYLILEIFDCLLPKKKRVAFFVTARTGWDSNQQILYSKLNNILSCLTVNGNNISRKRFHLTCEVYFDLFRSKIIIFDHSLPYGLNPSSHLCINLWHGSPIKKIRLLLNTGMFSDFFLSYQAKISNYMVANSSYDANIISEAFSVPFYNIIKTGVPRNEYVTCTKVEIREIDLYQDDVFLTKRLMGYDKCLLWAPTYRASGYNPIRVFKSDDIINILNEYNAILLIRGHKFSKKEIDTLAFNNHIIDVSNLKNSNVILRHIDILITDYSSIWVDFLPLKRPIIIYAPDKKKYTKEHGFISKLEDSIPTFCISDYQEFISELKSQLTNPRLYVNHKLMLLRYFNEVIERRTRSELVRVITYSVVNSDNKGVVD